MGRVLEAHHERISRATKVPSNEAAPLVRFRRRPRLNLRRLIQLAVLCLIVVIILKLLNVI